MAQQQPATRCAVGLIHASGILGVAPWISVRNSLVINKSAGQPEFRGRGVSQGRSLRLTSDVGHEGYHEVEPQ